MWDLFGFYLALLSYDFGSIYKGRTVFWTFYRQASYYVLCAYQSSSVTQSWPTLCDLMDCSTPGLPVHHQLLELAQTHVHRVGDAIQSSHPL